MVRKLYLLEDFDLDMFDFPESIVIDKIPATQALIEIADYYDNEQLINTITDKKILEMIEREGGVKLEVPNSITNVKLERCDKAIIIQTRGKRYVFYEIII